MDDAQVEYGRGLCTVGLIQSLYECWNGDPEKCMVIRDEVLLDPCVVPLVESGLVKKRMLK